jgi:hypothetical protein
MSNSKIMELEEMLLFKDEFITELEAKLEKAKEAFREIREFGDGSRAVWESDRIYEITIQALKELEE